MTPHRLLALTPVLLLLTACRRPTFPNYPDGYREFAYIANSAANTVTVLDLVYLRPDRNLQVGLSPVALAVNPLRPEVYVLNAQPTQPNGSLSILNTDSNTVVATIPLQRNPTALSVDPTGQRAFIANTAANTVTVLDLDTRRPLASYPTGAQPTSALLSPDSRTLLVTNQAAGTVTLFTPAIPPLPNQTPNTKVGNAPLLTLRATLPTCPGPTAPVILPDSSKGFIACSAGHQVLVLALAADPASPAARQDPTLLVDHPLALLDVGQNPTSLTLKPDGGEIFVSNSASDSISEISTQTNEVGNTQPIGNHPTHGIVSADNTALYISDSGAGSLSLYSVDDGKFLSSLRTGDSPGALAFSADQHLLLAADQKSGDVALIRTTGKLGPSLFTILPAGGNPTAIAIKATPPKP